MKQKKFIGLIEDHIMILGWISIRLKADPVSLKYSNQHLKVLMRLYMGGRALLKDIAKQNDMSSSNLCIVLKHLEKDGLVAREQDKDDRRNTWYSVSSAGADIAEQGLVELRHRITELFSGLSKDDESRLTSALGVMNELFNKIKSSTKE